MQTYEGMFLVDAGNPDFHAASEPARVALERNEAEILAINPWDERRLAYEIKGRRRGLYILAYFKAPPGQISDLERDCQLDERVLRMLVLRRDDLSDQEIQSETPAMAVSRRAAARKAEQAATEAKSAADADTADKKAEADTPPAAEADKSATAETPPAEAPATPPDPGDAPAAPAEDEPAAEAPGTDEAAEKPDDAPQA